MKLENLFEASSKSFSEEQLKWLNSYVENFKLISHTFSLNNKKIDSINNFFFIDQFEQDRDALPDYIRFGKVKIFNVGGDCTLTNCDLLPETASSIQFYAGCGMPSFKGIHKTVKQCEIFCLNETFQDGILDIFQIKGVHLVNVVRQVWQSKSKKSKELGKLIDIVGKHLRSNDVFACQDALEDAGLGKYC